MNPGTLSPEMQQILKVLPFVDADGVELNLWCPEFDGSQDELIAQGEMFAENALGIARAFQVPALIALVLRDMVLAGRFGPCEAGFVAAIASAARVGSYS